MVSRQLVTGKLAELDDRVERVKVHHRATADELRDDRDALDLVSFNLMLAVQSGADIASHIIADERWRSPSSLSDGFDRLRDHGVIQPSTARALRKAVGLRKVVAHGYARVDARAVHAAATAGLADLEAFAREVARWITEQS